MRTSNLLGAAASAAALLVTIPASAADEIKDAICAVQQAIVCEAYSPCERALPGAVNLPALLRIHKDKKLVETRREDGSVRTSPFESASVTDDAYILQGTDEASPWGLRIDKSNGRMVFTVARADAGYMGFGVCSAAILGDGS